MPIGFQQTPAREAVCSGTSDPPAALQHPDPMTGYTEQQGDAG